jgi:hypothetical protein
LRDPNRDIFLSRLQVENAPPTSMAAPAADATFCDKSCNISLLQRLWRSPQPNSWRTTACIFHQCDHFTSILILPVGTPIFQKNLVLLHIAQKFNVSYHKFRLGDE